MTTVDEIDQVKDRLTAVEDRLAKLERSPVGTSAPSPQPPSIPPPPTAPNPAPAQRPMMAQPPPPWSPLPAVAGNPAPPSRAARAGTGLESVLRWVGLGLVVLSAVFLVGAAIDRGWIVAEVQLLSAALVGVGLIVGAFRLAGSQRPWAVALATGGAAILPTCAAAGNAGLVLYPNLAAMALLGLTTVALGAIAHRLRMEAVAAVTVVAALALWPWIGEEPELSGFVVACWLGSVCAASVVFTLVQRWTVARLITLAVALPLVMAIAMAEGADGLGLVSQISALTMLVVIATLAWLAPAAQDYLGGIPSRVWERFEHHGVLVLPTWFWASAAAVIGIDERHALSWFGFGVIALFAVAAAVGHLGGITNRRLSLSHGLGISILTTAALAVGLTTTSLLLAALAAQAAVVGVLAWRFGDRMLGLQAAVLGAGVVTTTLGLLLIGLVAQLPAGELAATGFVVMLVMVWAIATRLLPDYFGASRVWGQTLAVAGWGIALVWLAAAFVHGLQGQVVVSIVWTVAGAAAIVVGVRFGDRLARLAGIATLSAVVTKILTIDLASVDALWRVALLFIVGAGLLRLGYVLPRLARHASDRIENRPLR